MTETHILFRLYWSRILMRLLLIGVVFSIPAHVLLESTQRWDSANLHFVVRTTQLFMLACVVCMCWYRHHLLKRNPRL